MDSEKADTEMTEMDAMVCIAHAGIVARLSYFDRALEDEIFSEAARIAGGPEMVSAFEMVMLWRRRGRPHEEAVREFLAVRRGLYTDEQIAADFRAAGEEDEEDRPF
jgi:hypothetical protein